MAVLDLFKILAADQNTGRRQAEVTKEAQRAGIASAKGKSEEASMGAVSRASRELRWRPWWIWTARA
jgi:hypothetical protein